MYDKIMQLLVQDIQCSSRFNPPWFFPSTGWAVANLKTLQYPLSGVTYQLLPGGRGWVLKMSRYLP